MRAAFRLGKALSRPLEDHKLLGLSGSYFQLSSFDFQISSLGDRGLVTFYHVLSEQVQGNPHKQGETGGSTPCPDILAAHSQMSARHVCVVRV